MTYTVAPGTCRVTGGLPLTKFSCRVFNVAAHPATQMGLVKVEIAYLIELFTRKDENWTFYLVWEPRDRAPVGVHIGPGRVAFDALKELYVNGNATISFQKMDTLDQCFAVLASKLSSWNLATRSGPGVRPQLVVWSLRPVEESLVSGLRRVNLCSQSPAVSGAVSSNDPP